MANKPPYSLSSETQTRLIAAIYGHEASEQELVPQPPLPHFTFDAKKRLAAKNITHEDWLKALFSGDPDQTEQALVDIDVRKEDRQVVKAVLALIDTTVALAAYKKISTDWAELKKKANAGTGAGASVLHDY